MLVQLTGLSGAGKSTISYRLYDQLDRLGFKAEIIDGDQYRKNLCKDLGFSKADRCENIRRLGKIAYEFSRDNTVAIISANNPYNEVRDELKKNYKSYLVYVKCGINTLVKRDTKGLYQRAFLLEGHPEKLLQLTGVNDPFEIPEDADLILDTERESINESVTRLLNFILLKLQEKSLSKQEIGVI